MAGEIGANDGGNLGEQVQVGAALLPQYVGNGAWTGLVIDRLNFNAAVVALMVGAKDATTFTGTTWKVQEGDLANGSDMADLVGTLARWGGVAGTDPAAVNTVKELGIDLTLSKKRYFRIAGTATITGGNAQAFMAASYVLSGATKAGPV